jgi:glycosyltransferase involved in cell wall biosynthesis
MTVLHVITSLNRGGAETALFRSVCRFKNQYGDNHVVISIRDEGYYGSALRKNGVQVHVLGVSRWYHLLTGVYRIIKIIHLLKPDLIQTWLYHADLLGGLAGKISGGYPVVWGIHTVNLDPSTSLWTRAIRRVCALLSWCVPNQIICVAKTSAESHASIGYCRSKIKVVPNGFELPVKTKYVKHKDDLRAKFGIQAECLIIGCVARYHPDKGYANILKAAELLAKKKIKFHLTLIGPGVDQTNDELMKMIYKSNLQNQITLFGQQDNIQYFMSQMDIFCLPSRTEAFPLVVGEAMALGTPVVCTDVGDVKMIVGRAGFVVPPEDPDALAEGLCRMIEIGKVGRQNLANAGEHRIQRLFSMEKYSKNMLKIYSQVKQFGRN